MKNRIRLDQLLVERGLAPTQREAGALILSGAVLIGDRCIDKAGTAVDPEAEIRIRGRDDAGPYVSRGGVKLKGALDQLALSVRDLVALDVGASTGGFTDCLLQEGAARVYALDVGYGQLAWKLRQDKRVVVIERTNIRTFDPQGVIDEPIGLAVIDASFISLKRVLPAVKRLLPENGAILALVKPQFEVAKGEVGEHGVVRDPEQHRRVLEEIEAFCAEEGLAVMGQCESPITGPAGNREFFIHLRVTRDNDEH